MDGCGALIVALRPPPAGFLRTLQPLSSCPFATRPLVIHPMHQLSAAGGQQLLSIYKRREEAAELADLLALITTSNDNESACW